MTRLPRIAILFSQFGPFHVDRIEAVAQRLAGRAQVLAVEVASASHTYAWEVSGAVRGARKLTLFPGARYEDLREGRKLAALWNAVSGCDRVFSGIPYSDPAIIALSWRLRLAGRRVVMMTESKRDDFPRVRQREWAKRVVLSSYDAAIVGGPRQADYMRDLGFLRRPVLLGYDTVGIERVRSLAGETAIRWQDRPFLYVGRFVEKKNLFVLLDAYAHYVWRSGEGARRLLMVGDGPLKERMFQRAKELGVSDRIEWPGFLDAQGAAQAMKGALALLLVSTTEQWGLVVNEAMAAGIPCIVSANVGARETMVTDGENGFVLHDTRDAGELSDLMARMASDEESWKAMSKAATRRAPAGDVVHFADAVENLIATELLHR